MSKCVCVCGMWVGPSFRELYHLKSFEASSQTEKKKSIFFRSFFISCKIRSKFEIKRDENKSKSEWNNEGRPQKRKWTKIEQWRYVSVLLNFSSFFFFEDGSWEIFFQSIVTETLFHSYFELCVAGIESERARESRWYSRLYRHVPVRFLYSLFFFASLKYTIWKDLCSDPLDLCVFNTFLISLSLSVFFFYFQIDLAILNWFAGAKVCVNCFIHHFYGVWILKIGRKAYHTRFEETANSVMGTVHARWR